MTDLHVTTLGAGPRVVFVHGSLGNGEGTFRAQRPLAGRFRLELLDRRGFGASPARPGGADFERDADDLLEWLAATPGGPPGGHVVGHSYGAVASLVAAGRDPSLFRSLAVIEPPAFGLAGASDAVAVTEARMRRLFPAAPDERPGTWNARFLRGLGFEVPDELPIDGDELRDVVTSMTERFPGDARPDLDAIRAAGIPVLVVRGDWSAAGDEARRLGGAAFAAICETVAARTAGRLVVMPGATHNPQLTTPDRFNAELAAFVTAAERDAPSGAGTASAPAQ